MYHLWITVLKIIEVRILFMRYYTTMNVRVPGVILRPVLNNFELLIYLPGHRQYKKYIGEERGTNGDELLIQKLSIQRK